MINLKASGIEALLAKFNKLANEAQNDVQSELNAFADDVVRDAKNLVKNNSSDEGNLLRNINPEYGSGSVTITANTKYAAYIEFGTRKFAAEYLSSLPTDWQAFAGTFKGPMSGGGNFKEMLLNITEWCKRKGIDEEAAYPIARKILIDGIKPRPFLYPSLNKNLPILIGNIKDIFK